MGRRRSNETTPRGVRHFRNPPEGGSSVRYVHRVPYSLRKESKTVPPVVDKSREHYRREIWRETLLALLLGVPGLVIVVRTKRNTLPYCSATIKI